MSKKIKSWVSKEIPLQFHIILSYQAQNHYQIYQNGQTFANGSHETGYAGEAGQEANYDNLQYANTGSPEAGNANGNTTTTLYLNNNVYNSGQLQNIESINLTQQQQIQLAQQQANQNAIVIPVSTQHHPATSNITPSQHQLQQLQAQQQAQVQAQQQQQTQIHHQQVLQNRFHNVQLQHAQLQQLQAHQNIYNGGSSPPVQQIYSGEGEVIYVTNVSREWIQKKDEIEWKNLDDKKFKFYSDLAADKLVLDHWVSKFFTLWVKRPKIIKATPKLI